MAYTYDPSQSIQQGFQQAKMDVGNIFTQVIQQQQRDYTLAENAFQNIEALKKDLNIFGQKNVTEKSNALLKEAGSAILANGKLDYSKLGEIRQKVSDIKDLKQGYELGSKEYERMLQLGIANKDNMVSFEKFYKDLSSKMGDENLVKNPQDLQRALADTYSNNLDSFKIFGKGYLNANPYQKISQDIKDPKTGALMRVQGELPAGWTLDAQGNKIPPAPKTMVVDGKTITMDYADQELARLQATNPDALALMKKQAGIAGVNLTDKEIVKASIDRIPMTVQSTQVKSQDELRIQAAQAQGAEFNVKTQGKEFEKKMQLMDAQIQHYENSTTNGQPNIVEYAKENLYQDTLKLGGNRTIGVTGTSLGKNLKIDINGQQAVVGDVLKSNETGDIWVKALAAKDKAKKTFLVTDDQNTGQLEGLHWAYRKIKNPENFAKELNQKVNTGGYTNKTKPYIQEGINQVFGAPDKGLKGTGQGVQSGITPAKRKPAPSPAPPQSIEFGGRKWHEVQPK